jgi:hypothetical protein
MQVTYDPQNAAERQLVAEINSAAEADEETDESGVAEEPQLIEGEDAVPNRLTVETFLDNAGDESFKFVRLAVRYFAPAEEFGFKELSSASGETVETLRAFHRNLSRTAVALGGHLWEVIPARTADGRVLYRIPPKLHALEASRRSRRGAAPRV